MKSIKEIFNKEMVRVFKDKKMVFSVIFSAGYYHDWNYVSDESDDYRDGG